MLGGGEIPAVLAVAAFCLTLKTSASKSCPLGVCLLLPDAILASGWILLLLKAFQAILMPA